MQLKTGFFPFCYRALAYFRTQKSIKTLTNEPEIAQLLQTLENIEPGDLKTFLSKLFYYNAQLSMTLLCAGITESQVWSAKILDL